MDVNVKEAARLHYAQFRLSDEQVRRIEQLEQMPVSGNAPKPTRRGRSVAFAAAFAALLATFVLIRAQSFPSGELSEMADEFALHHAKGMAIEVEASSFDDLRSRLNKLDFAIITPSNLDPSAYAIEGGRYCTLHGVLSAQLRLRKRDSGGPATLYQLPLGNRLGLGGGVHRTWSRGVRVSIWEEGGLVVALAEAG